MKKFCLLFCFCSCMFSQAWGQKISRDQLAQKVLPHVDSVGAMQGSLLKDIIGRLIRPEYGEVEMTYAIYCWVAKSIMFDPWAYAHPRTANNSVSEALIKRHTTGAGFAGLFKAMCDIARIECVVIDGSAKAHAVSITDPDKILKHYWNAVKIRNTWFYVDATFGAGEIDANMKYFKPDFTDVWCFANRELFTLSHYPGNKKWIFTDEPVTKAAFNQAPIVGAIAMKDGIYYGEKVRGRIRAKVEDCKRLVFELPEVPATIMVDLMVKRSPVQVDHYVDGNILYVDVPFTFRGEYPIIVNIGGKPAYSFMAEVAPKRKRA